MNGARLSKLRNRACKECPEVRKALGGKNPGTRNPVGEQTP